MNGKSVAGFALATVLLALPVGAERPIVVASKNFTEAYILGEAIAQLLESEGFEVDRKIGLGGTKICYDALVAGDVDVYPEYTGTIAEAIKDIEGEPTRERIAAALEPDGVEMLGDFGFNNTYALAVARSVAEARGLERISDLRAHADLRMAVSHEFLERADGWPGLQRLYGLAEVPDGIEHALAYDAIANGTIDLTDAYSTDGELNHYDLRVLEDDRGFFPQYMAVPIVRSHLDTRAKTLLRRLAGTLNDVEMQGMNAAAVFGGRSTESIAGSYLHDKNLLGTLGGEPVPRDSLVRRLVSNTQRHLFLVVAAVAPATLVAVLLALAIFKLPWFARGAVYVAGLMQTIPSIALLALLIPLVGIGWLPAVIALFLYALLPILRNAVTALTSIEPTLRRVAVAMGLKPTEELRHVFVPLAMPSIVAGVRTAMVICIGTATLAAFIGAGGLGDPIVKGLALNDTRLILEGAIPAALLAVFMELVFEQVERWMVPRHLRSSSAS